ncbi:MAG: hypothetical protein Ta2D_11820 [Rickettsiales bacterium]|nr:MAG: hypothetical protein Ta2D_11820 [Rickettsiales bacterium]
MQNFGFSEYETYGNYVLTYHKDKYLTSRLRTLREGYNYFSEIPSTTLLNEVAKNFDTITFKSYHKKNNKLPLENYLNEIIKENY